MKPHIVLGVIGTIVGVALMLNNQFVLGAAIGWGCVIAMHIINAILRCK